MCAEMIGDAMAHDMSLLGYGGGEAVVRLHRSFFDTKLYHKIVN
jgi:hypothetical protein